MPATSSRRRPTAFSLTVGVLILALVVALGWQAWTIWGTSWLASTRFATTVAQVHSGCSSSEDGISDPDQASDGQTVGAIALPSLGVEVPLVKGTQDSSLKNGVGWYSDTAAPGEVGNFAVAGYRLTHGAPFASLLDLNMGDEIIITTCHDTYRYVVQLAPRDLTVSSSDSWVLDAVPGQPETLPYQAWMTLTANQDLLPTHDRAVGFALLES